MDHTFSYRRKKFICAYSESSAHAHGTKFRGRNFQHFKISVGRTKGNGRFATDPQVRKQMSDSDTRTGTFHQTPITAGDTACSVKGV